MSRSIWKPLYNNKKILTSEKIFIFNRRQIITSNFLNQTIKIYNGIRFFEILVNEKMLGFKFGEFAPTRKLPIHKKKKNKKK
jgi:small subunit ribosomal protein S19